MAHQDEPAQDPREYWEGRYGGGQVWSGKVNAVLADLAPRLTTGHALDLGCGEGADVIWLAEHGWRCLGVDISEAAIGRARQEAAGRGIGDYRASFVVADLTDYRPPSPLDLVTASFLHSRVELPRRDILRRAVTWVKPGGSLLITAHAAPPPWAEDSHKREFRSVDPDAEIADLGLQSGAWETRVAEVRHRRMVGPDGVEGDLQDSVVLLHRIG